MGKIILFFWYLFGCYMMGALAGRLWDIDRKISILGIIGFAGILTFVIFLMN